jgi:hypothetical protein
MRRSIAFITILAACGLAASATFADDAGPGKASIIEVSTPAELREKFCNADPTVEHVVVLPTEMFVDSEELICPVGPFKLYRILEHNDPEDFEYYLDPPFGTTGRLGCDGKGGRHMKFVAVNCRPE